MKIKVMAESINKVREYYLSIAVTVIMAGTGYIINKMDAMDNRLNNTCERVIKLELNEKYKETECSSHQAEYGDLKDRISKIEAILNKERLIKYKIR